MTSLRHSILVPAMAATFVFTAIALPVPLPAAATSAPAAGGAPAKRGAKPLPKLEELASARVEGGYATVLYKDGRRGLLPLAEFSDEAIEGLKAFAAAHPLAKGKSSMVTVTPVAKAEVKKTIAKQAMEDGTQIVQLVSPAKLRDQIGPTCMFYARVHYLDIAGYPVPDSDIYKVINVVSQAEPYSDYRYHVGMQLLLLRQKPTPIVHYPDGTLAPFEWARQQLRKGRPILAALPENIWLSLPADFLATHRFEGNDKIGHQIVINGFTYNPTTKKSTFHIVNSWHALQEFDVTVEPRDEANIQMEQSLSPRGEEPETAVKVVAGAVTLVKPVGKQNLYSVETNLGPQRVMAATEQAAKEFVEMDTTAKDSETAFGEYIMRSYDFIYHYADPKIRHAAAAAMLAELFRIPPGVALPHLDLEVKSPLGKVYFVRVAPEKVVRLTANTSADALEYARRMVGRP